MNSLFEKEIKILDTPEFWSDYKKEQLAREPYHKQDVLRCIQIPPASQIEYDVNILIPYKCMKYYMQGQRASVMAVKWVLYCEDDSLYWCRSWTGNIIYRAQFVNEGSDYRIIKLFVNNDSNQVDTSFVNEENKPFIILDFLTLMDVSGSIYPSVKDLIAESKAYPINKKGNEKSI